MGTLTASRTTRYGHDLRCEVIGEEGAVQVGRLRKTPVRLLDRFGVHHDAVFTTPERMGDAFVSMIQAFVDCVQSKGVPPVGVEDGLATLAVALAGRKSIQTGAPVAVSDIQKPTSGAGTGGSVPVRAGTTT
jgi:scyllo-inositol 2-dehydrogenase (NAD+)